MNRRTVVAIRFTKCFKKSFTFAFLNVRSLNKHSIDISCDKRLQETDILCLTETQIPPSQNTERIEEYLSDFFFVINLTTCTVGSLLVLETVWK